MIRYSNIDKFLEKDHVFYLEVKLPDGRFLCNDYFISRDNAGTLEFSSIKDSSFNDSFDDVNDVFNNYLNNEYDVYIEFISDDTCVYEDYLNREIENDRWHRDQEVIFS